MPAFWLGVVLILIFSVNLGWFPSSGAYDVGMADSIGNRMKHMILPLIVMIFSFTFDLILVCFLGTEAG